MEVPEAEELEDFTEVFCSESDGLDPELEERWVDIVRRLRRLAWTRRKWGLLGQHLKEIKERGQDLRPDGRSGAARAAAGRDGP